jgi:hypothetical protein
MDEFKLDPEDKNIRLAVIQKYQKKKHRYLEKFKR